MVLTANLKPNYISLAQFFKSDLWIYEKYALLKFLSQKFCVLCHLRLL